MKAQLDLVNGKVFCPHCAEYVKPRYPHDSGSICLCSICIRSIRNGEARRKYENGFKWCSLCAEFKQSWKERKGWCESCHTKLRMRAYSKTAKQERERSLVRY